MPEPDQYHTVNHLVCYPSNGNPFNAKDCVLYDLANVEIDTVTGLTWMNLSNIAKVTQNLSKFKIDFEPFATCVRTGDGDIRNLVCKNL
jgi:hypothetical protein